MTSQQNMSITFKLGETNNKKQKPTKGNLANPFAPKKQKNESSD